jgi:hypothetical protein
MQATNHHRGVNPGMRAAWSNTDIDGVIGYLSVKAGYRHVFSEESKTGFYLQPSAGYGSVITSYDDKALPGLALAIEGGYSIEVGQNSNDLLIGLKYESDLAKTSASSIALRFAYNFHLGRKRE